MTWTRRWRLPNALPCCTTAKSLSKARAPRWSPIRARGRSILASEALAVCGIDTFYGDSHVLHDVSFALQRGRLLGLLGRNGAGKTTCMSTVMGFLKPRRGAIELQGENIAGLAPDAVARKGVCLVPQGGRMFRNLSVNENLMVAAQRHREGARTGWSRDRTRAHGESTRAADGRALRRAGAAAGCRSRTHHCAAQGGGSIHRARGAEHQAHARP